MSAPRSLSSNPRPPALEGARVTVMGLGRFGGGLGVTRFLAREGADVLLTDLATERDLADPLTALAPDIDAGRVTLRLGTHNVSDFTTPDLVIANPAIPRPWDNRFLRAAHAADIPITTEIQLLLERLPSRDRLIAVTGTAGKSTTSAMLAHALREAGATAHLGGNIGGSLLDTLHTIDAHDHVVLELSSAQLHWLAEHIEAHPPAIAIATNLAANHHDWHGTQDHYVTSKRRLFAPSADGARTWILTQGAADALGLHTTPHRVTRTIIDAPSEPIPLQVPGAHNQMNAALALEAVQCALDAPPNPAHLEGFQGLPHRLRNIGTHGGITCFDDSKCTTPQGTALAIEAFAEPHGPGTHTLHLIAGGYDKHVPLGALVSAATTCAHTYTIGTTGEAIATAITSAGGNAMHCTTLDDAVATAKRTMHEGDTLLLSPGCASWDQFPNYEARGRAFAAAAMRTG